MQKTKRNQSKRNQSKHNQSKRNQSKRNQSRRNRQLNGGSSDFNVPIRSFYPQNTLAVDTQRMIVQTGGKHKNFSRKWLKRPIHLKGGSGFFGNFGTFAGSSVNANLITGTPHSNNSMEIPTQQRNINEFKV
jgi:hypothetical protein